MKNIIFPVLIFICSLNLSAQEIEFLPSDYDNPAVFEKGQNAPHAFHIPFSSVQDAIDNIVSECENYKLLNGQWNFMWVEKPELAPDNFYDPQFNTSEWDKINVPSNWQMEGYGHPKFRNIPLTFESDPPHPPDYYNPAGCYKRKFGIPKEWMDREIMLRFEGIKSASYIWINGENVGYNQGGFEPAEFNITQFINEGVNDISVKVIRFSDGSYLEDQDMWRLSGIYRDVKLIAMPKVHINDYYITTDLDENYKDAELKVELRLDNKLENPSSNNSIIIDVIDDNYNSILSEKIIGKITFAFNGVKSVELKTMVENPLKWSAEYPNLYTIIFDLQDDNGNTLEAFSRKIGFREIEMVNEVVSVNGVPIKLNGVNSHMHHPRYGQAVPLETLREDLLIMKRHNINCVRTSHYPPSPEYLDMADELGVYIIDEVGDEAHQNIYLSKDSTYTEMYKDRSRKLVHRDRNHPSVLMWSAGNESGSGFNIHEVIKTGKAIDPSRPAWMYGGNTFHIPFEDVTGPRYWVPEELKKLAEGKIDGEEKLRPSFMDEYLAATGNSVGGMDEYWELIRKYPRLMGGAIWDWVSPAVYTPRWILPDSSPKNNNGQIMGRPEFVEGSDGRALSFSGHDDWIEFYRSESLDITGNEITIDFWVNPSEIPQPNIFVAKGEHGYGVIMDTPQSIEFYVNSNTLDIMNYSDKLNNGSSRISAVAHIPEDWYGSWHRVTAVYNGDSLKLYIDGQEAASAEYSGNIAHTPFPLCIGRDAEMQDQGQYAGRLSSMIIDNVRIYNSAIPVENLDDKDLQSQAVLSLDFENDLQGEEFFAVGLGGRSYGIIWADRTVQPEIYQIKKSGQPFGAELLDKNNGLVKIYNHHHFKNLDDFYLDWNITAESEIVDSGRMDIELPAQSEKEIILPVWQDHSIEEVVLTLSLKLKEATEWAKAGYEIAFEQFVVKAADRIEDPPGDEEGIVTLTEDANNIMIAGTNFNYTIDKQSGQMSEIVFNGISYLLSDPLFNVWRAPLANDTDPWGSGQFSKSKKTPGLGRSIDNQLRTFGMKDLVLNLEKLEAQQISKSVVQVGAVKFWNSSNQMSGFKCIEQYKINGDGTVDIELDITPFGDMPEMLQKTGWQFELSKSFSEVEWYGRGRFETYPDRKTGAKIGVYKSNVDDEYVPYLIPQDYGNHTDTRWMKVENITGNGLLFTADAPFNFSYHKYATDNLDRALYSYQLTESQINYLNIDFEVSGVGSTAIRQLPQYRLKPAVKVYKFSISPY